MVLGMRVLTFIAELWAIWIIYRITKQNSTKLIKSYFAQTFHLLVFGIDFIFDVIITYITVSDQFDQEYPGAFYLLINCILCIVI